MTRNSRERARRQTRAGSRGDAPGTKQRLRTCVGCRSRYPKESLLRCLADGRGRLVLDILQQARGRGVYVCPSPHCIRAACRRGGFERGLRRRVTKLDPDDLARLAAERIRDRARALTAEALVDGRLDSSAIEPDLDLGRVSELVDGRLGRLLAALAGQLSRLRAELVSDELGT